MKKTLSLLIPAYNEEKLLENTVDYYHSYLKSLNELESFEIIICVNGSTDNTETIAKALSEKYEEVRYLATQRKGLGIALTLGIKASENDFITYMPGDGEIAAEFIGDALDIIDDSTFVIGSRRLAGAYIGKSFFRKILSYGLNITISLSLSSKAAEAFSAKMYPGAWAREIADNLKEEGFVSQIELCYYALKKGLDFKSAPSRVLFKKDPSQSSVKVLNTILSTLKAMIKYGIKWRIYQVKSLFIKR